MIGSLLKEALPESIWDKSPELFWLSPYDLGMLVTTTNELLNCQEVTALVMLKVDSDFIYVRFYAEALPVVTYLKGHPAFITDELNSDIKHWVSRNGFSV